jgi:integrase
VFARMAAGVPLVREDIEAEAERIRIETLAAFRAPSTEEQKLQAQVNTLKAYRDAYRATLDDIYARVAEVGERHGIAIEQGTPLYRDLANAVLAAFDRAGAEHAGEITGAVAPPATNGERFSQAFEAYIVWQRDKRKARPATVQGYTTIARRFIEFAKDPLLGAVTIDQAQRFLDEISKSTSPATTNLHHTICKAVFEHARNERGRFTGGNPFGFKLRKHRAQSKAKFTVGELNKLFTSDVFTERQIKPGKYDTASCLPWATAIGLFSGLALEEICQLRPQDIRQEAGGMVIAVTRAAAVSGELKRPARERTVPLHPALEKLGLLRYIAAAQGQPLAVPPSHEGRRQRQARGLAGQGVQSLASKAWHRATRGGARLSQPATHVRQSDRRCRHQSERLRQTIGAQRPWHLLERLFRARVASSQPARGEGELGGVATALSPFLVTECRSHNRSHKVFKTKTIARRH